MKKIIHFHPNWIYANYFVIPLIEIERKIGLDTILVTAENTPKKLLKIEFLLFKKIYMLPLSILKLIRLLYIHKPEIIFCHNSTGAILPLLIAKILFVKNIIYFNHGLPFIGYRGVLKYLLYYIEKINCNLATEVITVSFQMLNILNKITQKKVSIINYGSACGINLIEPKKNQHSIKKIKKEINFSSKDVIILYVGRPNKRKGFLDLLKIWEQEFISNQKFKLILLGINSLDIEKVLKRVPENIFPQSFVENVHDYHHVADYLFMTSHHEGLNYSVLESFKYQTIVLSNKIPGVSELIRNRKNGFLIGKNCSKSYINTVKDCEKNTQLKLDIIKEGKKTLKKYDRNNFLEKYKIFLKGSM